MNQPETASHLRTAPIPVDFPLRGEWIAANTPAHRIPSHGTDQLGQRYAYDFLRIERGTGFKFFRPLRWRYFLTGVCLEDCYGWSAPIHAPFDGTVVVVRDGWPERKWLHFFSDLAVVLKNSFTFSPRKAVVDLRPITGNYLILKMAGAEVYAFLAHARTGSIRVHDGDAIHTGQHLADVGHSGNSTAPHLHFQLMDRANLLEAEGLPCCFKHYDTLDDGSWREVHIGLPGRREFIRYDG